MVKYFSTRSSDKTVSFEEAVIEGLAPDGGLYIPTEIPRVTSETLDAWSKLDFAELAVEIFSLFIDTKEIPRADLEKLVKKSYSTFRATEVTPITDLGPNLSLLELFHGPTYAFKDVALQFVGNLFEYFLVRRNKGLAEDDPKRERITVVGATSGDTGSAAIYGLRNKKDVSVFILYPTGRVSPIQEQQMTTILDGNVHTISVPGTFDDCQDLVKQMFADREFNDKYHVGAVNSINWARILAQITYYFVCYFKIAHCAQNQRLKFVVPTGNFGDILAGFYARRMGLPIDLVIATNNNDILYRFIHKGDYTKSGDVHSTLSPAMDILVSSNFERFLWHAARDTICGSDAAAGEVVRDWMNELKTKGSFTVPSHVHANARSHFEAHHTTDEDTLNTIKHVYTTLTSKYILDPHSAVAVNAALHKKKEDDSKDSHYVALSTAHPAKFAEAVNKALDGLEGYSFEKDVLPEEFKVMMKSNTKKIMAPSTTKADIKKIIIEELQKEGK